MIKKLHAQIAEFFVGNEEIIDNLLICLLAGGHVLLEDVPGVGKTTLAKLLAQTISCSFGRIQFTPDTLPSDVVGVSVYNMKTREFEYKSGAVMHQIILADEINRTSPKTQASMLEAMAEGSVTVDGIRHPLPKPFMVIATQNPVEFLGTYPLPEAQMDRFMMRLSIGYPSEAEEVRLLRLFTEGKTEEPVNAAASSDDILTLQEQVKTIHVSDAVLRYIRQIIHMTREEERFTLGASPRAALFLTAASRACAFLNGRSYVKPDDVKTVAINVLHHRVVLSPEAKMRRDDPDAVLRLLMSKTAVPKE